MGRIATSLPYTELEIATGNYDTSRATIDRIVLHTMVGTADGAAARFDDPTSKVSAHYGVKLDGSLIHWLEEYYTAYHSGNYPMNQRSIGIEHEDNGDYNGIRPDVLYTESAKLVADICKNYNIPIDRQHILKHSEVIATGCPDALDVDRIVNQAKALTSLPDSYYRNLYNDQINTICNILGVNQNDPNRATLILNVIHNLQNRPTSCPPQKSYSTQKQQITDILNQIS